MKVRIILNKMKARGVKGDYEMGVYKQDGRKGGGRNYKQDDLYPVVSRPHEPWRGGGTRQRLHGSLLACHFKNALILSNIIYVVKSFVNLFKTVFENNSNHVFVIKSMIINNMLIKTH